MSDGKPYCDGWMYTYSRTDGQMVCHLFPPGPNWGSPSLCGFLVRADRVDWLTMWGEPDEENNTSGDI